MQADSTSLATDSKNPVVVWWIKRDIRLGDNACLAEAQRLNADLLPFFCFEPSVLNAEDSSAMHVHAQWQALTGLRTSLRGRNADVLIAYGDVVDKLNRLHGLVSFSHLLSHEEIGNAVTFERDKAVAAWCRANGIVYQEFPQSSVRRGGVNRDRLQQVWRARISDVRPLSIPEIRQSASLRELAGSTGFPKRAEFAPHDNWQPVSESDAMCTLNDFLSHRSRAYRGGISSPNTAFTAGSRLSVHLAWGTLTARQVWHGVQQRVASLAPGDPETRRWKQSLFAFQSRLHWRDHFIQRLESEPGLEFESIHPSYRSVQYENDERLLAAWKAGSTGYPLVDAVMRCLATTGFVNFRMRAMIVSFACHVLHLDWRLIHPHLASVFRDYEPGIHLSQLQMQAGVIGWNAIRVYNPTKQLIDWDNHGRFVQKWVPELRRVSVNDLLLGERPHGYPSMIVPFAERAKQMTDLLYAIRKSPEAIALTSAVYNRHGSRRKETRSPRRRRSTRSTRQNRERNLFSDMDVEMNGD